MGRDSRTEPELILRGLVLTMVPSSPVAEAVAVGAGRITAVGSWDEIRPLRGPRTEVLDMGPRTILPVLTSYLDPCQGQTRQPSLSTRPLARSAYRCRHRRVTANSSPFAFPTA